MSFTPRFAFVSLLLFSSFSHAESIKYLQWWDEYLPTREELPTSLIYNQKAVIEHHLDIDGDGVENDTLLCRPFKMAEPFNPPTMCPRDKVWANYRDDRPSGRFYGGITANFLNVSDITRINTRDEEVPAISKFSQDTVQNDGASIHLYEPRYPHNVMRALNRRSEVFWADMTLFVVDPGWTRTAKAFYSVDDAAVNFSALFLWKKEDFVNGGSSADKIVFDETSNIVVDLTRHWINVEDARFIVQDGDQLWISEYVFEHLKISHTIRLNPLHSRWAKYNPEDCDIELDLDNIEFVEHKFTDVQGVGAYFARYSYMPSDQDPQSLVFIFDNFQLFATSDPTDEPSQRTIPSVDVKVAPSFAFDDVLQPVASEALFSTGVSVNGSPIQAHASDQLDIRGVITPDPEHVGKKADIIALVGYLPSIDADPSELQAYMLNSKGAIKPWNGNVNNLAALNIDVTLTPEYRVQLFPVSIERFKNSATMDSVVLSCDDRPATYTGIYGQAGVLLIYYGYILETGELVYSQQPIIVELLPDPVVEEPVIEETSTEEEVQPNPVAEEASTEETQPDSMVEQPPVDDNSIETVDTQSSTPTSS
ncbi:hypothetical protein [Candidatus Albibeggiatoa sp. nov. NOAA]|uniref:hypothetical protein n=1 Tax=Candidatus Albibeggiatoa sp. nov. NOAA TaxID=3162724 RepID=UPI0032F7E9DB|nr:hypothetical protein [Thiotrichaceae bacterium]